MKILHIINSIDKSTGGPARSVPKLCEYIADQNHHLTLAAKPGKDPIQVNTSAYFSLHFVNIRTVINRYRAIRPDMMHLQHIWTPFIHLFAAICHIKRIPYIVTPRGMLEPWILKRHPLRKKMAMRLYQRHDLRKAACIHATCAAEREQIRKLGFRNPIAMVPNGIDLSIIPYQDRSKRSKKIVFISRIHPKKGIELLLDAWKGWDHGGWTIEIAGEGEKDYVESLQKKMIAEQITDIRLIGPCYGAAKWQLLEGAELFVLPSYSENFGIAIAESLAMGVPVITTHDTPWEELQTYNCGWWIRLSTENLQKHIQNAIAIPAEIRREMGIRGRQLIVDNYEISQIALKMRKVYDWMAGTADRPDCVSLPSEEHPRSHPLRVMHFITSIDQKGGGTTTYMELIAPHISSKADMVLVTGESPNPAYLAGVHCYFLDMDVKNCLGLHRQFRRIIQDENPDIIHINGIWQPQTWWFQRVAQQLGKKVVLSPHGMLEPWILNRNPIKKKLALALYQRKAIHRAEYLHATASSELDQFRKLGFQNPAFVVANGIDLSPVKMKTQWRPVKQILFLSRIHPKKGIELLIDAIAGLKNPSLQVIIAGTGDAHYIDQLKQRCRDKAVDDQFTFKGAIYGEEKWQLYHDSDLFVLPSYSENFGIVIAEALATGLPVITTTGTPWKIIEEYQCGYWINPTVESLQKSLCILTNMTEFDLQKISFNSIYLVDNFFTIGSVTSLLLEKYLSM